MMYKKEPRDTTSWQAVGKWYDSTVGEAGHYYHKQIVIPGVLRLLELDENSRLLDLACGQGILGRQMPEKMPYTGLDIAPTLIKSAQQYDKAPAHKYQVWDVTQPFPLGKQQFTHAAIILALQNIEFPDQVLKHASQYLCEGGRLIIVLNHPCFRIPRQSSWGIDTANKMQFRQVNRYMSPMKIPLQAHPSQGQKSATTLSFHNPLSAYFQWLREAGFLVETTEEWISDKVSTGGASAMENRSRKEFPLFLTLLAKKTK
jgi:ubiquinone/menaquinone biosynthesis C-methylase UbiE